MFTAVYSVGSKSQHTDGSSAGLKFASDCMEVSYYYSISEVKERLYCNMSRCDFTVRACLAVNLAKICLIIFPGHTQNHKIVCLISFNAYSFISLATPARKFHSPFLLSSHCQQENLVIDLMHLDKGFKGLIRQYIR